MKQSEPSLGRSLSLALEQLVPLLRSLSAGGVSATAFAVLARLDRNGDTRLTDLATAENVSQPAMSQLVNRMQDDGLLVRRRSGLDRRGVLVGLAPHGREILHARRELRVRLLDELADRLDESDRTAILGALPALGRLIQHVEDEGKRRS